MAELKNKKKRNFSDVRLKQRRVFPIPERPAGHLETIEAPVRAELPVEVQAPAAPAIFSDFENSASKPAAQAATAPAQPPLNFVKKEHLKAARASAWKKMNVAGQLRAFAALALIFMLILQSAKIIAAGQKTKTAVLGTATEALNQLEEAAALSAQQQFTQSEQKFQIAKTSFEQAQQNINNLGPILNSILILTPKGQSAQKLLSAGEAVALAGQNFNNFYGTVSQIHYGASGLEAPSGFPDTIKSARAYLQKGTDDLLVADDNLNAVDSKVLPAELQIKFSSYKDDLNQAVAALKQVDSLLGLAADFIGTGPKSILVLFENNREMRPTGGFIGTYGYFRLNSGKIISQKISSIYDLDGQLGEKIAPPGAFHDLTDHWGLRDSNWFADFRMSAQKAISFYEKEGSETPDAVIAVTPDTIVDLLRVTGPIAMPKYGVILSADNFRDLVQLNTSDFYDKQENTPKQMLADFAPLLLERLMSVPKESYADLIAAAFNNLSQKNVLLYDRNPEVQSQLESFNWAGALAPTDRDYLEIVNTNLGGRKTDLDITQSASLQSEIQDDGSIVNTLSYTRTLHQSLLNPDTNIDYARFLVPEGATLLAAQGFTQKQFYRADGSGYVQPSDAPPQPFAVDPDLALMDQATSIDAVTGTVITKESGKSEFANWIETKPGQTSTVMLKYRLPFNADFSRKFSLLLQKQPGNPDIDFSYSLDFGPRHLLWSTPFDLQASGSNLQFKAALKSDIFIGAVLAR